MQILAGTQKRLNFNGSDFDQSDAGEWVIASLNFVQFQELRLLEGDAHIFGSIERAVVSLPGGVSVAEFVANPLPQFIHPLYQAIWAHTLGN